MIVTKVKRNKKIITSSYFEDIKELKRSKYETDYLDLKRNSEFDIPKLQKAYLIQEILLWRKGCIELSDYVNKLPNNQLEGIETFYLGRDIEEETEKDKTIAEEKVIADPDN